MGLRLVAHYFDRSEALIVRGALQAVGVPAFVHGFDLLTVQPWCEVTFGGYRVVVPEEELADAVAVLREARSKPLWEGEALVTRYSMVFATLAVFVFIGWGVFLPWRDYEWGAAEGAQDAAA
jgi:hypothetical protein